MAERTVATPERARRANIEAHRELTRRSGGRIVEADGVCVVIGSHASPAVVNNAFRIDPRRPAADVLTAVDRIFRESGRRPELTTFEPWDADLETVAEAAGWNRMIDLPVMARTERLPVPALAPGADVRWLRADRADDLRAFREVLRDGFADDDDERAMVDVVFADEASLAPPAAAIIASLAGTPSAVAALYEVGEEGVVGWVATVPEARRRGLGSFLTAALTNRALDDGISLVALQASPMGLPVYGALGFETVGTSRIWLGPVVTAGGATEEG